MKKRDVYEFQDIKKIDNQLKELYKKLTKI